MLAQAAIQAGKKRLRKPPRQIYPNAVEMKYREMLGVIIDQIQASIEAIVYPALANIAGEAGRSRADGWVEDLASLMAQAKIRYNKQADPPDTMLQTLAGQTNVWNNAQWRKIVKATIGVDVFQNAPNLSDRLAIFAQQNAQLIQSLSGDTYKNISVASMNALRQGKSHTEVAKTIQEQFGISRRRAKLIARDQISKLNGDLTQMYQQAAGIEMYVWRANHDERTRASHAALDGKLCRWDDFTVYSDDDGKTWKKRTSIGGYAEGHPGDDYQCRCTAEPYMADIEAILKNEQ